MTVYLLHLSEPLSRGVSRHGTALQAGHYLGFANDDKFSERMSAHACGRGARFTQVCLERGISWQIARIWRGPQATRKLERRLKNGKNAPKLCPICNPNAGNLGNI